ncbi:MAG TPA: hypothetical protein VGI73_00495, partial [Solirubrobacterales bacterium]
ITGLDLPNRIIIATVRLNGVMTPGVRVACWLDTPVVNPAERQQALASIPYYGFERDGTGTGKIADTRMYARTRAWFSAVQFFSAVANSPAAVWPLLGSSLASSGYFSVWARVLSLLPLAGLNDPTVPPNEPPRTFMQSFLRRAAEGDVFPGTNTAMVP